MKIWCDVCDKRKATVFCSADEAVLCDSCDRRVHHANKVASKHLRSSLVNPTFKGSPLCDICQEKRALLFCQEDRAILCRECDLPIHKVNEHTKKHNRFLLTGVKLSASSSLYPNSSSSSSDATTTATINDNNNNNRISSSNSTVKETSSVSNEMISTSQYSTTPSTATCEIDDNPVSDNGSISTTSFSEYLMETIPGWRVEDLLDPSSATTNVFCKTYDQFLPFLDQDSRAKKSKQLETWLEMEAVPQISPPWQNNKTRHIW
ncbi:hypothetical protein ACOSQ2_005895 [Xanthoceras sorbifolium]